MTSNQSHFNRSSKPDAAAVAFLIAMGFALALTAGASLTASGIGKLPEILHALGFGRETAIVAEQKRQAATVGKLEATLHMALEEIATVREQVAAARTDPAVEARLASLDSALARIRTETAELREARDEALADLKAGLAQADLMIGGLRSSIDDRDRSQRTAIAEFGQRVDRLERSAAAAEPAGTIGPAASVTRHRGRQRLSGWTVRSAWSAHNPREGRAMLSGQNGTFEVAAGTLVPGLGRVESVRQRASRWIVVTEKGTISQH